MQSSPFILSAAKSVKCGAWHYKSICYTTSSKESRIGGMEYLTEYWYLCNSQERYSKVHWKFCNLNKGKWFWVKDTIRESISNLQSTIVEDNRRKKL